MSVIKDKIMKTFLAGIILASGSLLAIKPAYADYFLDFSFHTMNYGLAPLSIPASVGETSGWTDNNSILFHTFASDGRQSYVELSVNGTLLGDGVTWATNNPGIGIQFRFTPRAAGYTPAESTTAPNYRINMDGTSGVSTGYFHLYYRIVRLLEKIPAGSLTSAPEVTLNAYNPDGDGTGMFSGLILAGITSQPKIDACIINAPQEITLSPLYGVDIVNGAMKVTDAPTITLTNCPGAVNKITYNFSAVYGTHKAANGVLNTAEGEGYAQGVYIQIQNADGTPHTVNNAIALSDYAGSGDYTIPDFKVAYYVDDKNEITAGNVKSAIELKVEYN